MQYQCPIGRNEMLTRKKLNVVCGLVFFFRTFLIEDLKWRYSILIISIYIQDVIGILMQNLIGI